MPDFRDAMQWPTCPECHQPMTYTAEHYFGRCGDCERKWYGRLRAWREGAPDAEFDKLFSESSTWTEKEKQ